MACNYSEFSAATFLGPEHSFTKSPTYTNRHNRACPMKKPTTAYVALLRGINVGKGNRVPMAELRALLTALGYSDVATLLNSGNAVFCDQGESSAEHAQRLAADIKAAIASQFGFDISVVVKSADAFAAVVQGKPFAGPVPDHARFFTIFAQEAEALNGLSVLVPLVVPPEEFAIGPHAAYLHCASGVLESKAGAALLGKVGRAVTTRNWATTLKLQALLVALSEE
jgi:uncharacterized protein (DUF1697 family)